MRKLLLLLAVMYAQFVFAQNDEAIFGDSADNYNNENSVEEMPADTILLKSARLFSPKSIQQLKRKKEFAYVPVLDSLLAAQQNKVVHYSPRISLFDRALNNPIIKIIFWLIPLVIITWLLFNLFKTRGLFSKKPDSQIYDRDEKDLDPLNHDFGLLAQEAALAKDYRTAVKYQFLETLQQLSNKKIISYAPAKTNVDYAAEISSEKKKNFYNLVRHYEYTWYGHAPVSANQYESIRQDFINFKN
ncbi:MAG: DUF4129 domain-containing protein [Ferruginibacter sp.]